LSNCSALSALIVLIHTGHRHKLNALRIIKALRAEQLDNPHPHPGLTKMVNVKLIKFGKGQQK